ncbi:hypothetical protein IPM65_06805 [Candidatus Roizmanbacteria bacterium]|nr:MAG: hypothetical protein IPM65_06805 [Candidatus Roizmanbacteria bacterium]
MSKWGGDQLRVIRSYDWQYNRDLMKKDTISIRLQSVRCSTNQKRCSDICREVRDTSCS